MIEYRVTKYNPALRDARGAYLHDEWIMFSQIGLEIGGVVLTKREYERVEQAYVDSALAFLNEGGLTSLRIEGLENRKNLALDFGEQSNVSIEHLGVLIRQILREEFWCRFEGHDGFLHFGWDFYMYVGVPYHCRAAEQLAKSVGLYPEEFASPYKEVS
jgi:hypothetical protein